MGQSWFVGFPLLALLAVKVCCIPLENFFPFGDEQLSLGDDESSNLTYLSSPLPVLGRQWTSLRVTSNGVIALNDTVFNEYSAQAFPHTYGFVILCPFWADSDPRISDVSTISHNNGRASASTTARVAQLIRESFHGYHFKPTSVFVTTWNSLHPYGGNTSLANTFQCVLATDGDDTFVMFLYADGLIQWARSSTGGVQIGIDGGNRVNYYSVPGSLTPSITNITRRSNVRQPGLWIFKLDTHIIAGPPVSPVSNLRVINVHAKEAGLKWNFAHTNGTGLPESFQVDCASSWPSKSKATSHLVRSDNYPPKTSEYTYLMTGLKEGTRYTCSITARNIFGGGPISYEVHITTHSAPPATPSPTPPTSTSSSSSKLIGGVLGGILSAVVLIVIVLVLVMLIIIIRRKKTGSLGNLEMEGTSPVVYQKIQTDASTNHFPGLTTAASCSKDTDPGAYAPLSTMGRWGQGQGESHYMPLCDETRETAGGRQFGPLGTKEKPAYVNLYK